MQKRVQSDAIGVGVYLLLNLSLQFPRQYSRSGFPPKAKRAVFFLWHWKLISLPTLAVLYAVNTSVQVSFGAVRKRSLGLSAPRHVLMRPGSVAYPSHGVRNACSVPQMEEDAAADGSGFDTPWGVDNVYLAQLVVYTRT
eukprot:72155-Prorocentrum_minimum.AAC.2